MNRADQAQHLVNGEPVNGYGWFDFMVDEPLFTIDGSTAKLRVEIRQGRIIRVEGGDLTDTGRAFYEALAGLGLFQVWSDDPNHRIRFQVDEHWGLVDRSENAAAAMTVRAVFTSLFGITEFGQAGARH